MTTPKFNSFLGLQYILALFALFLTSCSSGSSAGLDEEVNGSIAQSVTISSAEVSEIAGSGKITFTGDVGTAWSAEIAQGSDFCSFALKSQVTEASGSVGELLTTNILYFYYTANNSGSDRQITIAFSFDGESAKELVVKQISKASADSPYAGEDKDIPRWFELPAKVESSDYMYVTHSTSLSGGQVRNYSMCYDIENHAAAWVAYPYHAIYSNGDVGRNEDWTYDPKIPVSYQPNLSRSYKGSYDRGHQMASEDRQATVEMNRQTFYFSNMTPQLYSLNQQKWATLEKEVRNQICSDTLYVVTGSDFTTTIGTTTDRDGKTCPLPGAFFKVLLRTKSGNSGKAVSECSADELQAIGFWAEHRFYNAIPEPVSVQYIEDKTGFDFFPAVPDQVKASFKASDWKF